MTVYAPSARSAHSGARKHAVLVPGFVGFDALGQLRYYPGVTSLFQDWPRRRDDASIDYFDNFPTASVEVRAHRLAGYLAKKVSRGEIAPHDEVTLIGHSTGALDIRALLRIITTNATTEVSDGHPVPNNVLLGTLKRVVFLSAPHFGTNVADYAARFQPVIQGVVQDLGLGLQLNRAPISDLRRWVAERLPAPRSDFTKAIVDALDESDESQATTAKQRADSRDARAELALWLEHMSKDFGAVHDLTTYPHVRRGWKSPAHFTLEERSAELASWPPGLQTRSYVTMIPKPASNGYACLVRPLGVTSWPLDRVYEVFRLLARAWLIPIVPQAAVGARTSLETLPGLGLLLRLQAQPEALFEFAHAICAQGRFDRPSAVATPPELVPLAGGAPVSSAAIDRSANDGIVNTASMLWPHVAGSDDHKHFLVHADHADVIGHYAWRRTTRASAARTYTAYDLFQSDSGFGDAQFTALWHDIFEFAFG